MHTAPYSWKVRKGFWSRWQTLRYSLSKPKKLSHPEHIDTKVKLLHFHELYPKIPLKNILVFDHLPGVEASLGMRLIVGMGLLLNRVYPQMQASLPEIDQDIHKALSAAMLPVYTDSYRPPARPPIFAVPGVPDLGLMAIQGPYSVFIERASESELQWDFSFLGKYEHHDGLLSLAVKVIFSDPNGHGRPQPLRIESDEFGCVLPEHENWDRSVLLALCAANTHLSLTRHFNYVHLISGNHWDVAARDYLPDGHPVQYLIWGQIFDSCYTNYGVTRVQMDPDGDFVNMFSFTHKGLLNYFDDMYLAYDVRIMDPEADWERRGLGESLVDRPSHNNLVELFSVMFNHARRYLEHYYASDEEMQQDPAIRTWLEFLDSIIPNGIGQSLMLNPTRAGLARLIGAYMYEGNTIHELAGTNLWDYQLWVDKNPPRIYRNGNRLPLDVYQRVLNNNFALQLQRAPLCGNYSDIASDDAGRRLFMQFFVECQKLQVKYDLERWQSDEDLLWRMEPRNLKLSMNG